MDGGYVATALGHAIATQGDTLEELREMVRDAVRCHFGDGIPGKMPSVIREALRVYELVEQEDNDPQLEAALRHALRGPLKKYKRGHFAALAA